MTALRTLVSRLLGRGRRETDLDDEIAAHLALLAAEFERRGMRPHEARLAARREFGGVSQIKEAYRGQRRLPFLDTLAQDLAYALRQLRRNPGFAAAAVVTLVLGIGANAAIYQVLDAVAFRSLPVREPRRLVQVQLLDNGKPQHFSYPLFRDMAARQQVLEGMFATSELPLREAVLRGRGPLRRVSGSLVTGGFFRVLGVRARLGRVLTEDDDRLAAPPVAVISHAFWDREFGRGADAIGKTLQINKAAATIVGVAPPGFFGETVGSAPDAWLPMSLQPQVMPMDWLDAPYSSWLVVLARLRPDVPPRQAQAALDALYRQLAHLNVRVDGHQYRLQLEPASRGIAELQARFEDPLWVLMGITGLVLLIACSNLANLLLGRATARTHEIGVRLALGAGRARLVRQLLTESFVLSGLGASAALALSWRGSRALVALASAGQKWQLPLDPDVRILGFTAAVAIVATCLFGLAPALAGTRVDVHSALQGNRRSQTSGRPRQVLGKVLVVAQISISLLLLSAAALLVGSLWNLRHQDFGFRSEGLLMVDLPLEFTPNMRARNAALRQPLYDRMNALPGVRSAAIGGFGPMGGWQHTGPVSAPERPARDGDSTRVVHVSPRYFETMGIRMVAGRGITEEDRAGAPKVVVLSETAARALFGGANPVGRLVTQGRQFDAKSTLQVVGVAHDVRFGSPRDPYGVLLYVPMAQIQAPVTEVLVRASGDPALLVGTVRAALHDPATDLPIGDIRLLSETIDSKLANERMLALVSACFGALALALTCVGVYGVISYAVERRTQEIGIRLALGASRGAVSGMLMRDVALLVAASAVLGGAGAVAMTRAIRTMLFGFGPNDYSMLLAVALLLTVVAAAAGYLPARRAARLDPMDALRQE